MISFTPSIPYTELSEIWGTFQFGNTESVFFFPEDVADINRYLDEIGVPDAFSADDDSPKRQAAFVPHWNLALVRRSQKIEDLNGGTFFESRLIHESVHGSGVGPLSRYGDVVFTPRTGQHFRLGDVDWGAFLEEGLCEMVSARYRQEYMVPLMKGMTGRGDLEEYAFLDVKNTQTDFAYSLPLRYFFVRTGEVLTMAGVSTVPGYALELLCHKKAELFPALVNARKEVEGLRKVAQIVNSIRQGLYSELMRINYNINDFEYGLKKVLEATK